MQVSNSMYVITEILYPGYVASEPMVDNEINVSYIKLNDILIHIAFHDMRFC